MSARPRLGAIAISRNEAQDLPGFLTNLLPWVDEIVIVDDGSTDETVQIAQTAGHKVRVIQQKMTEREGFAGQRNAGITAATSDWLLHMDIDERVPPELAQEIREAIAQTSLNAFRYPRLNFFTHRPMQAGGWQGWNNPQLARKGHHHFVNKVHERCVVEESNAIGQLHHKMWHLNDESYKERMSKSFQYCQLEAEKMLLTGKDITAFDLCFKPIVEWGKKYLWKQGFRDGTPGLIAAIHSACAVFRTCALVWDEQNRIDRQELEMQLQNMWNSPEEKLEKMPAKQLKEVHYVAE